MTVDGGDEGRAPAYVWLALAGFAFSVFSGAWGLIGLPLNLDRPLLLLSGLLALADPRCRPLRLRFFWPLVGAFVLLVFTSWVLTGALSDTQKAYALLDRVLMPIGVFALGAVAFSRARDRLLALKFFAVLGLYVSFVGIAAFFDINDLVYPSYMTNDALGLQSGRARGPFLASEPFGMVCAVTTFVSLCLLGRRPGRGWSVLAAAAAVSGIAGVIFSLTRSVWLGAALGAVIAGLSSRRTRRYMPLVFAAVVLIVGAVFAAFPSVSDQADNRLNTSDSLYDRVTTNDAALRIIEARPLTGIGWGNFVRESPNWVRQGDLTPLANTNIEVHNVFLSRAADLGLIGGGLWIALIIAGPVWGVARAKIATEEERDFRLLALACGFVWLIPSLFSPNPYPLANWSIWFIAGVAGRRWLTIPSRRDVGPSVKGVASTTSVPSGPPV